MIRLLFADLRQNARIWTWTFVVATVCGAAVSSQFALLEGGRHAALALDDQDMADAAMSVSVTVIVFVALSALAVLSSTTRLAIEGRRPDIGLWRALGMKPRTAGGIIVGELCVIGTLAGIVGSVLAVPCASSPSLAEVRAGHASHCTSHLGGIERGMVCSHRCWDLCGERLVRGSWSYADT